MVFTAEISQSNRKKIREQIRETNIWRHPTVEIFDIANLLDEKLRGWINYYGLYSKRSLRRTLKSIDLKLVKWLMKKHKASYRKAVAKLKQIEKSYPGLFYHWQNGYS
jgi:hypothetical protein